MLMIINEPWIEEIPLCYYTERVSSANTPLTIIKLFKVVKRKYAHSDVPSSAWIWQSEIELVDEFNAGNYPELFVLEAAQQTVRNVHFTKVENICYKYRNEEILRKKKLAELLKDE